MVVIAALIVGLAFFLVGVGLFLLSLAGIHSNLTFTFS